MGLVLAMFAARNVGVGRNRNWLVGAAGLAACSLILFANVANPESFVVHHNVTRAEHGHSFDAEYLRGLSDDALPALAGERERSSSPGVRAALEGVFLCRSGPVGVATLNVSTYRARDARSDLCSVREVNPG